MTAPTVTRPRRDRPSDARAPTPPGATGDQRPIGRPAAPIDPADGFRAVEAVLLVVLGLLVGQAFGPVYGHHSMLGASLVASVVAVGLSATLGRGLRWSLSGEVLVSVAALLVVGSAFVVGGLSPGALHEFVRGLFDGPHHLLSASLPADAGSPWMAPAFATVWLAVAAAAALAQRTRSVFLPVLPFVAAIAVPAALGASLGPPSTSARTLLLTVAAVVVLLRLLRPDHTVTRSAQSAQFVRRRRITIGLPMLLIAALLAVPAAERGPFGGRRRRDPRHVPAEQRDQLRSPLTSVDEKATASQVTTAFTADGPAGVERWRLAVLDDYDGIAWSSGGAFAPTGSLLPPPIPPTLPAGARTGTFTVTVDGLGTRFLPSPGEPLRLTGPTVRFDASARVLLSDALLGRGRRYRVEAEVGDPPSSALTQAQRDRSGPDTQFATRTVPDAARLSTKASQVVSAGSGSIRGSSDYQALVALQRYFDEGGRFRLARQPQSGESMAKLLSLVAPSTTSSAAVPVSREQLAAAFGAMARTLGFATRVVVGYRTFGARAGHYAPTNRDLSAWVEVKLQDLGWVPFDVNPSGQGAEQQTTTTTPQTTAPAASSTTSPPVTLPRHHARRPGGSGSGSPVLPVVFAVLVALALVAALWLGRAPFRRWRRRGAADPRRRVDGAWAEVLDRLRRARLPVAASMTVTEVRDLAVEHLDPSGAVTVGQLAGLVTVARFAPQPVLPETAAEAWRLVDTLPPRLTAREGIGASGYTTARQGSPPAAPSI